MRESAGVTFYAGLRALLRHDPDVLMVGEIRDEQTAVAAVRAALSGHLVLSTTHARDWLGAAARLTEFGIARSVLAEALLAVLVQSFLPSADGLGKPETAERRPHFSLHPVPAEMARLLGSDLAWPELRSRLLEGGGIKRWAETG
ncbi:MAG: GspE family protein [Alicyclobacillus sp.]|nr:GspE family protein [Alicyclobacillus sp.]